eukprot:CAMPEP_0177625612 /NCGR_PEP_ID=MMETSP0419_2-20121207/30199_1 /TAXON_ID=582737 /ORGANISM="Tetraselmis sp., Strain GSL018" /LENGTH=477 /DNA_ID=CAMNT_0019126583 /DNA_START=298 /DNA_END=1732 /DNA_ORIENTATION=-
MSITKLVAGGNQFEIVDRDILPAGHSDRNWQRKQSNWDLGRVEIGTLQDVLGLDPYYAKSYSYRRYDDFVSDRSGNSLEGLLADEDAGLDDVLSQHGNCALVTAEWEANSRYEMTLRVLNPRAPSGAAAAEPQQAPRLWMAPVSYHRLTSGGGTTAFRLRGDPYGTVCSTREGAFGEPGSPAWFFDPCKEAAKASLPVGDGSPRECLGALNKSLATGPRANTSWPYYLHPIEDPSLPPSVDVGELSCADDEALSPSMAASASPAAAEARSRARANPAAPSAGAVSRSGQSCSCSPSSVVYSVGTEACGPPLLERDLGVTTASGLAAALCSYYTAKLSELHEGELSDRFVLAVFLDQFIAEARPIVDESTVFEANRSVWREYGKDPRRPDSPSRALGIEPSCAFCDEEGFFENYNGNARWRVFDLRYAAANVFRAIGASLNLTGHPCPELFDPGNPLESRYGPYRERMCQALSEATEL